MRILLARLMVVGTALLIVALAAAFAVIRNQPTPPVATTPPVASAVPEPATTTPLPQAETAVTRGRDIFTRERCTMCHSFKGDGNARLPLDDVGGRLAEREIRLWITAPQEMRPGIGKRAYTLSTDDLDALVTYLMGAGRF